MEVAAPLAYVALRLIGGCSPEDIIKKVEEMAVEQEMNPKEKL